MMRRRSSSGSSKSLPSEGSVDTVARGRIFTLICCGMFCGQMGLSIISPFFPKEATAKGVDGGTLGWIFSIFELATMVGTPLAGALLVKSGARPLIVGGNALGGLGNVCLGLVWFLAAGMQFTTACFALRILAGFALALQSIAGFGLLPALYGEEVSSASGIMEGTNGLAMILGPIVGSFLFELGGGAEKLGYVLPFMVLGCLEMLMSVISALLMPPLPSVSSSQPSMTNFRWRVAVPFSVCVVMGIGLGLLGPTLQPHLAAAPLNFSVSQIGFVFAATCLSYALTAPVIGYIDDATEGRLALPLMIFGSLLSAVAYGLLAPVPVSGVDPNPTLVWTSTVLLGVGLSTGLMPVFKQFLVSAAHEDKEEQELAASSMFTIAMSCGSFLGPSAGGMLMQQFGVRVTYTIASVFLFMLAVGLTVVSCADRSAATREARLADPLLEK